jgi:hypothetical protein
VFHTRVDLGRARDPKVIHIEHQVRGAVMCRGELEIWRHGDCPERARFDAQRALDTAGHVDVEAIEYFAFASGAGVLLDLDHVDRAGKRAGATRRAAQVAGVDLVDEPWTSARPDRHFEPLFRILDRDGWLDQVADRGQHAFGHAQTVCH